MKHFLSLLLLLCATNAMLWTSCSKDIDGGLGVAYNSFDIEKENYDTYSGFLLLDRGPVYNDRFALVFQNGWMRYSNDNGLGIQIETQNSVTLFIKNSDNTLDDYRDITISAGTFELTKESNALYNITQYNDTFDFDYTYGTPDENSASVLQIGDNGIGSVTINEVASIDYDQGTVEIDLTYTFTDGADTLTGQFSGLIHIIRGR